MATTVVLQDVIGEEQPAGTVRVFWADGTAQEFPNFDALTTWALGPDKDQGLTQRMCVAYALARSPDLSNIAPVKGKNFVFDLSHAQPIRVL